MGLGMVLYVRGYAVANALMKLAVLRGLHQFLYRRMYIDDLYNATFVAMTLALSRLAGLFDRYVVDGLVNLSGWLVRSLSVAAGINDRLVVDGAVDGVAEVAQGVGILTRAPQNGRIRLYVMLLVAAVALGVTATITVALLS
jgi:NADH:ubiquinone oxidoreductase subunit 5 (subunit L)/multisubunit Na+/H+ antiporter MnhA subunit